MNRTILAHALFALTAVGLSTACSDDTASSGGPATAGAAGQGSTGGSSFGGGSSGGVASGGASSGGAAAGGAGGSSSGGVSGGGTGGMASGGASGAGASGGAASGGVGGTSSGGSAGMASGGASTGGATCDRTGFTSTSQVIDGDATAGARVAFADAFSSETDPFDYLGLEIYEEFGATIGSQSFSFTGENYATCGVCLLGGTVCDGASGCQKTFMAQSGELEITALSVANGETFAASLSNATLAEITIDQSNNSTLVANGETWCVPSFSWSGPLSVQ